MSFTRVQYMYRDASNYKEIETVLLDGEITTKQRQTVKSMLDDGLYFIPEQIGWPHPGRKFPRFPAYDDDHCWGELEIEDDYHVQVVDAAMTNEKVHGTVGDWVAQMVKAKAHGWDDATFGIGG